MKVGTKIRKVSGRKFRSGMYIEVVQRIDGDKLYISDGSWIEMRCVYAVD